MRKADYQTLARILRAELNPAPLGMRPDAVNAAGRIARAFAQSASVDAPAFLAACGIDACTVCTHAHPADASGRCMRHGKALPTR